MHISKQEKKIYLDIFCRDQKNPLKRDFIHFIPLKPPYAKCSARPKSEITPTWTVSTAMHHINLQSHKSARDFGQLRLQNNIFRTEIIQL